MKRCLYFLSVFLFYSSLCHCATIRGTVSGNSVTNHPRGHFIIQLRKQDEHTKNYIFINSTRTQTPPSSLEPDYFEFKELEPGSYILGFQDLEGNYAAQFFGGITRFEDAVLDPFIVSNSSETKQADFVALPGRAISGTVTGANGTPLPNTENISISIMEFDGVYKYLTGLGVQKNGSYRVVVPEGKYKVQFKDFSDGTQSDPLAAQWYPGAPSMESADLVDLTGGNLSRSGIDASMQRGYQVTGWLKDSAGRGLDNVYVSAKMRPQGSGNFSDEVLTSTSGFYVGEPYFFRLNIAPGEYQLKFSEGSMLYESKGKTVSVTVVNSNVFVGNITFDPSPLGKWVHGKKLFDHYNQSLPGNWLDLDADSDSYTNLHEFAFGTDPLNAASGYPFLFRKDGSGNLFLGAKIHSALDRSIAGPTNAFTINYVLESCTDLAIGNWQASTESANIQPVPDDSDYLFGEVQIDSSAGKNFVRLRSEMQPLQ